MTTEYSYSQIRAGRVKEHFLIFRLHAWLTSAPLAWLFYKCGVSANGITILGMLLGLPAAALNMTGRYYWAIALFHLFFLLDGADGTLARGTQTTSATGAYLDDLAHYVFHGLYFISLGLGLALEGHGIGGALALAAGFSNTLNRAHRDLIKAGSGHASTALSASWSSTLRTSILGSFDFPNILVFITATAWRSSLLDGYLAYCAAANLSYLVYNGVRHVSDLRQSRSSVAAVPSVTAS
jgi:phosphatidylglycerophosphate synthase